MSLLDPHVLAFALVAAVLTITPGADTLLVVRNTLRGGRRNGILTTAGICSGLYVHAILSAVGVSAVIAHSPAAFTIMKLAGACYLAWLGLQSLRSGIRGRATESMAPAPAAAAAASRSYREGLLTNLLNPKVIVFYLALLPQFVGPGDAVLPKSLLLATIHLLEGIVWLSLVAHLVERSRRFFLKPALQRWLDSACGAILIALGARLALEQQ